jgi:hypothetical protein
MIVVIALIITYKFNVFSCCINLTTSCLEAFTAWKKYSKLPYSQKVLVIRLILSFSKESLQLQAIESKEASLHRKKLT